MGTGACIRSVRGFAALLWRFGACVALFGGIRLLGGAVRVLVGRDAGGSQDAVLEHEPGDDDLGDGTMRLRCGRLLEEGIVRMRVERRLAHDNVHLFDAVLAERFSQAGLGQLKALEQRLQRGVLGGLMTVNIFQGPVQVVGHLQQVLGEPGYRVLVRVVHITLRAVANVLHLRQRPVQFLLDVENLLVLLRDQVRHLGHLVLTCVRGCLRICLLLLLAGTDLVSAFGRCSAGRSVLRVIRCRCCRRGIVRLGVLRGAIGGTGEQHPGDRRSDRHLPSVQRESGSPPHESSQCERHGCTGGRFPPSGLLVVQSDGRVRLRVCSLAVARPCRGGALADRAAVRNFPAKGPPLAVGAYLRCGGGPRPREQAGLVGVR